ncbi:MAG: hypothetical protein GY849_12050 [Deltaproteobacteria bacterium]|nr:hypothetical protein [Deltaproteobacteria bacterium]
MGWQTLVAPLLNIPIRLLGRKQRMFNDELLYVLSDMAVLLNALSQQTERQQATEKRLQDVTERQESIWKWLESASGRIVGAEEWMDTIKERLVGIDEEIESLINDHLARVAEDQRNLKKALTERLQGMDAWLEGLKEWKEKMEEWNGLIQADIRDIALEVRGMKTGLRSHSVPSGIRTVDKRPRLTGLPEDVKVNLGCGHKPLKGYLNIDYRDVAESDIAADIGSLPFREGSVAEIASSHLIEHFREYAFKTHILPSWLSILKPSGMLRITCPNWKAMIEYLQAGRMTWARLKEITFGGQEYEGNDHYSMYTPETLTTLLKEIGFSQVEVVAIDRDNGGCPEMELVAIKG